MGTQIKREREKEIERIVFEESRSSLEGEDSHLFVEPYTHFKKRKNGGKFSRRGEKRRD